MRHILWNSHKFWESSENGATESRFQDRLARSQSLLFRCPLFKEQLKNCRSSSKLKSIGGPDKSQPKNLGPNTHSVIRGKNPPHPHKR